MGPKVMWWLRAFSMASYVVIFVGGVYGTVQFWLGSLSSAIDVACFFTFPMVLQYGVESAFAFKHVCILPWYPKAILLHHVPCASIGVLLACFYVADSDHTRVMLGRTPALVCLLLTPMVNAMIEFYSLLGALTRTVCSRKGVECVQIAAMLNTTVQVLGYAPRGLLAVLHPYACGLAGFDPASCCAVAGTYGIDANSCIPNPSLTHFVAILIVYVAGVLFTLFYNAPLLWKLVSRRR